MNEKIPNGGESSLRTPEVIRAELSEATSTLQETISKGEEPKGALKRLEGLGQELETILAKQKDETLARLRGLLARTAQIELGQVTIGTQESEAITTEVQKMIERLKEFRLEKGGLSGFSEEEKSVVTDAEQFLDTQSQDEKENSPK